MNEEIEKLLSAMTNIEDRLGQLSTTEETEKVKAELAELGKKQKKSVASNNSSREALIPLKRLLLSEPEW